MEFVGCARGEWLAWVSWCETQAFSNRREIALHPRAPAEQQLRVLHTLLDDVLIDTRGVGGELLRQRLTSRVAQERPRSARVRGRCHVRRGATPRFRPYGGVPRGLSTL